MSLGLTFGSFGDFVALIELTNRIRKEFRDAPTQFSSISAELRSLSIILQDLDVKLSGHQFDAAQQTSLAKISTNCNDVLRDLQKKIEKYHSLEYSGRDIGKHARKAWRRLTWEPDDVRELRERITSNITMLNAFQVQLSSQTILETKQGVDQLSRRQNDQERTGILDWLSKVDYALQQNDFISRRQPGTGEWLINSDEYSEWHQSPGQTLFCPGMPGAGKTICTATVINDLNTRFDGWRTTHPPTHPSTHPPTVGIAYIYCNFRRREDQRLEDLLLNLIKQLSQTSECLPDDVRALFETHQEKRTRPLLKEIWRTVKSVSGLFQRVFVVVDALDECQADDGCQAGLIAQLLKLQSECGVNVFATSRFTDIVESFRGSLSLEIRAVEEDVRKYVDGNLLRLPGCVRRNPELQEEIKFTIVHLVQGMFLLAQLHLESLIGRRSAKSIRTALTHLPTGSDESVYDQAYTDTMRRINGQLTDQKDLALEALSWITCARRPLTSLELLHALAIEEGETQLDEENISEIEDILTVCAGLVTTEDDSGIVRLVHYTTQEFFERTQKHWFPDAEAEITLHCITYLSFKDFESESSTWESREQFQERLVSHPLFDYSARYWGDHARSTSPLDPIVVRFLRNPTNLALASQALLAHRRVNNVIMDDHILDGLHFAAYFGLFDAAVTLVIGDGHSVDVRDTFRHTPLTWSAHMGHEDITRFLLEQGANIESVDEWDRTPLHWAVENQHVAVTRLLLEWGANPNACGILADVPLVFTARSGDETICQLLLERGAEVEARASGMTPLMVAASDGHLPVVKVLLDRGADIHAHNSGSTSFLRAANGGHESVCQYLLERGEDIETKDRVGWTSLHRASFNDHSTLIHFLLKKGADIEARNDDDETPIMLAARRGNLEAARALFRHGANVEGKNPDGKMALVVAAEMGFTIPS